MAVKNLERLDEMMRAAVPEYMGHQVIKYESSVLVKMTLLPAAGETKSRVAYVAPSRIETAELTGEYLSIMQEVLSGAYANETMAAAKHVQTLLADRGYASLIESVDGGVRVWFRGKNNHQSFYVSMDDASAGRIARGESNAANLVSQGIAALELPPQKKN